ncbi:MULTISPECIES: hypothetical protein [Acetobacteraceae]|jgi:hypothetical protein|uniref:Uncharacterized protein n=6 Tax=Acetobacteraceae TaxID=433 RepID=A0A511XQ54_9PROT|nr:MULTISPECIES: hypothetical protein [Acetobacteraceae]KXV00304.1 hypothetical protein AD929_11790 [Gluconobacter potus]MBB3883176.1 hypothetical protein [Acetobacter oeni]MBB6457866.1 hypothetical protein [Acetobacter lovaniensis]MBF0851923.1 hypothetical protein [Gluconobacter sp. R75690]MBF0875579.1 hypothetical protein [Gluconobacter cerevisiae]
MRISGISSIIGNATQSSSGAATEKTGILQSSSLDFSNISASNLQDVNAELYDQGKITLRQSGELSLLDGWALQGVNGGQLRQSSTGNLNAYSLLDTMINYQETNGIGDVKDTVASLKALRSTLAEYDTNNQNKTTVVA